MSLLDDGERRSVQNVAQFARDRDQNLLSRCKSNSGDLTRSHNLHSLAIQALTT